MEKEAACVKSWVFSGHTFLSADFIIKYLQNMHFCYYIMIMVICSAPLTPHLTSPLTPPRFFSLFNLRLERERNGERERWREIERETPISDPELKKEAEFVSSDLFSWIYFTSFHFFLCFYRLDLNRWIDWLVAVAEQSECGWIAKKLLDQEQIERKLMRRW